MLGPTLSDLTTNHHSHFYPTHNLQSDETKVQKVDTLLDLLH
jgi:hypothetical protein